MLFIYLAQITQNPMGFLQVTSYARRGISAQVVAILGCPEGAIINKVPRTTSQLLALESFTMTLTSLVKRHIRLSRTLKDDKPWSFRTVMSWLALVQGGIHVHPRGSSTPSCLMFLEVECIAIK